MQTYMAFTLYQRLWLCIVLPWLVVVGRGQSEGFMLPPDTLLTIGFTFFSLLQHLVYVPSIHLYSMWSTFQAHSAK